MTTPAEDPAGASPARVVRLATAARDAIERVAAKDATATPDDLFADVGEALFWLAALMDATQRHSRSDPLLSGLRWARNRVAHGSVVSAPVVPGGRFTMGRSSLRGGDTLRGATRHRWVPPEEIPGALEPTRDADRLPDYREHVAGRFVVETLREALTMAMARPS